MQEVTIWVGNEVFEFADYDNWCDTAKVKFSRAGLRGDNAVCVDARGRICLSGKEFMRARDQGTWPVKVYPAKCG